MNALTPFRNSEFELDIVADDSDGFRVMAPGLAHALGFRDAYRLMESIPDAEKGYTTACTPGGEQRVGYVTEAGFYRALGQRQAARIPDVIARESVERFQTWVYGTVLPDLRRGESSAPALSGPELLARAVLEANAMLAVKDERIAELEPKAAVADRLLNAEGDYSVGDAAKILSRRGAQVKERSLWPALAARGWIYRAADGRWHVYSHAIAQSVMSVIPQSHYHPRTGELVTDAPQCRVTPKGIERLFAAMTSTAVERAS